MSENDLPPGSTLSKHTTPTWEMELLISGVTVFALLQLPGAMDQAFLALLPRLDSHWDELAQLLFMYSKMSVMMLAIAFVLHLTLRGYWIALVGMHSIYPQGINWDRLKIGPIQRRLIDQRGITMVDRIETADNRASIVFALGVSLALVMVGLVVMVALCFTISGLLAWLFDWKWMLGNGAFLLVAMVASAYALAHQIDRRMGARLSRDGWLARAIVGVYRSYGWVGFGSQSQPTMRLLQSHVGERKVSVATFFIISIVSFILFAQLVLQRNNVSIGDYAHWPDAELGKIDSLIDQHYRDQVNQTNALLPTIDSMFPTGNYLSLIVPFDPRLHPDLLASACPTIWRASGALSQRTPLLDCMARLEQLELDGQPMVSPSVRYYADPKTAQNGVIMIVPIASLAPGEHVLSLKRPKRQAPNPRDETPDRYQIAFWK